MVKGEAAAKNGKKNLSTFHHMTILIGKLKKNEPEENHKMHIII